MDPEERHSFARPGPYSFGEIDLPTSNPTQIHRGSVAFLALTQRFFHQHSIRGLYRSNQHPAYAGGSRNVWDWTVADRKMRLLPLGAMSLNFQRQVFLEESA